MSTRNVFLTSTGQNARTVATTGSKGKTQEKAQYINDYSSTFINRVLASSALLIAGMVIANAYHVSWIAPATQFVGTLWVGGLTVLTARVLHVQDHNNGLMKKLVLSTHVEPRTFQQIDAMLEKVRVKHQFMGPTERVLEHLISEGKLSKFGAHYQIVSEKKD